ncbi:MAG: acetate/propionate family kinase, partial [Candidatus Theseobacter exili]|nr:acetate/propionate family kinase [Candidatus Theseobacter exili]
MNILVFNSGSSSLTYKVFGVTNSGSINVLVSGKAHRVGVTGSEPSFIENSFKGKFQKDTKPIKNHSEAARLILQYVKQTGFDIDYIGHRFVHGGGYFKEAVFINETVLKKLEECVPLAPIHNPSSLSVIKESAEFYPNIRQYVSFDSAFHSAIPDYAYTYPLPKKIIEKYGFRKYGFHGLSYSYVVREAARVMGVPLENLKIVACHLGTGGASAVAIKNGRSIDTSMGYSPLPGLMMSTRSGDIDPMLTLYLMSVFGYRPDSLMEVLNEKSGLLGISGFSSDIRDIIKRVSGKE